MLNLGTGELLVIFLVALIVLGPNKLPEAARQMGKVVAELRRLSGGFQDEMREAMREPAPTLPPLPPEAEIHTPPAPVAATPVDPTPVDPTPLDPTPPGTDVAPPAIVAPAPQRRRAPLRAGDAVPAEQQPRE